MPRVKIGRDTAADRAIKRRNLIESYAAMEGLRTQKSIAKAAGKPESWLSRRMRGDTEWTVDDIVVLHKVLRFTPDDLMALVCGWGRKTVKGGN